MANDTVCSAQEEGTAEDVPGRLPRRPEYAPANSLSRAQTTNDVVALGSWADEMEDAPMPGELHACKVLSSFDTNLCRNW
jgi:hypothetical protein